MPELRLDVTNARGVLFDKYQREANPRRASGPKAYTPRCRFRKCPGKIVVRFCAITLLAFSTLLRSGSVLPACLSCIRGYTFPCAPGPSSPNQPCSSSLAGSFRSLRSHKTPPGRKTPLPGVQRTKRTCSSRTAGFLSPALNGSSPVTIPSAPLPATKSISPLGPRISPSFTSKAKPSRLILPREDSLLTSSSLGRPQNRNPCEPKRT